MAKEIISNDPLDGAEIKQIIAHRIQKALDKDCTLVDDMEYPGFSFTFEIHVKYVRHITPGTMVWGTETEGEFLPGETVHIEKIGDNYETDSPNHARDDHDMPVPVTFQTPSGPEKRKVHVGRPKKSDK